jgi:hypothetical protein
MHRTSARERGSQRAARPPALAAGRPLPIRPRRKLIRVHRSGGDPPRLEHPAARALLRRYPAPTALGAARRGKLVRLAKRHTPRVGERLIDELREALAAETVTVPAEKTAGRVIAELAEELNRLAGRRDQLEPEIEA